MTFLVSATSLLSVCPSLIRGFPDLKEQYEVQAEEGLDTFVVIDGLPLVPEASRSKLVKFLVKKLTRNEIDPNCTSEDAVFMPVSYDKKKDAMMTERCVLDFE